ncbi:MAG: hypothetical protein Kow0029_06420 [Candidatus Rifleibacteriota bacterium]
MKSKKGTTLVEIMLAVGILALAILPMVGLINYSNRGTREQDAEGIAANIAKEQMNRLLNVVERDNLVAGAGDVTTFNVKGNDIATDYTIFEHSNASIDFTVPQMTFHDPQGCSDGAEANTSVLGTPKNYALSEIYPTIGTTLIDIRLRVRWKTPGKDFDPRNEFILLGRRAFLVKE